MMLGTPVWLWLSFAVIIPVIIHLWNKKSGRPRLLGTFRFLPEASFASAKRIELHEVPLMLIRILLVVLIVLFLAGLFWEKEFEGAERIIVLETSSGEYEWTETGGYSSVEIPVTEIQQKGWWNILKQIDYQHRPESITVRGEFSEDKFRGERPSLNAKIDWTVTDSLQVKEKTLAAWQIGNGQYRALNQRRSEIGIQTSIEEVTLSEIQNNDIPVTGSLKVILSSENSEAVNFGFQYVLGTWGIEWEEQPISELARLNAGGDTFTITQKISEPGIEDVIEPNRTFGIQFFVEGMQTVVENSKGIVVSRNFGIPFMYTDEGGNLVVNGSVSKEVRSWVFAAAANHLILNVFGANDFLMPELIEEQRSPAILTSARTASTPKEQPWAGLWLMGLLVACWLTERWLAPGREM